MTSCVWLRALFTPSLILSFPPSLSCPLPVCMRDNDQAYIPFFKLPCVLESNIKSYKTRGPYSQEEPAEPILDFGGPYAKLCRPGGSSGYEGNTFVRGSLSRIALTIALEKQCLFHSLLCFQLVVQSRARYFLRHSCYMILQIFTRKRQQHRITINYHSCFHSCWPYSKTKLK